MLHSKRGRPEPILHQEGHEQASEGARHLVAVVLAILENVVMAHACREWTKTAME